MEDYHIMRKICKGIFLLGGGNIWYEDKVIGNEKSVYYITFCFVLCFCYLSTIVLELMAPSLGSLSEDEIFYAISHGIVHSFFVIKILTATLKRESIKKLIYNLIHVCKSIDDKNISRQQYDHIKFVIGAYIMCIYGATATYIIRGLINMFSGQYFYIFITYYAPPGDNSLSASCFRVILTFMNSIFITSVTSVDALVITVMIIYKYKFILLKNYIEKLNDDLIRNVSQPGCDINIATNKLYEGLKEAVIIHIRILRLSKELDESLGILTAMELFCTSFPAVLQLLQMAVSDNQNVLDTIKVLSFIFTVFLLLGVYLCTIGNISEEASTLTDSIFYCGWHLCPTTSPAHRKIRALVTISCAQSQQAINMKAFKMVHLTHATYIKVIKSTYSVYALLQAQNQN